MPEKVIEQTHALLEQEISYLSAELKTLKPEKEVQRETLKSVVKNYTDSAQTGAPVTSSGENQQRKTRLLPNYLDLEPEQLKLEIEKLLDLAWHKGIKTAAEAAQKSGPLVLDGFHDALTDKLYEEFKKRKLI